jgi:hypothetical protein
VFCGKSKPTGTQRRAAELSRDQRWKKCWWFSMPRRMTWVGLAILQTLGGAWTYRRIDETRHRPLPEWATPWATKFPELPQLPDPEAGVAPVPDLRRSLELPAAQQEDFFGPPAPLTMREAMIQWYGLIREPKDDGHKAAERQR